MRSPRFSPAVWLMLGSSSLVGAVAYGDEPSKPAPPGDGAETIVVDLAPQDASRAALRYALLPPFDVRRSGNAAPLYAKATMLLGENSAEDEQRRDQALDGPLAECRGDGVGALLNGSVLETTRLAARRTRCDWELPLEEQAFVEIVLPELHQMRRIVRVVLLQARRKTAEGNFDEAIDWLQTAYAASRHTAESPTLVAGLVALALQAQADRVLLELVQQPGAPNLYWALTSLPRPLVDLRNGVESERYLLDFSIPGWKNLADGPPSDAEADDILRRYARLAATAGATETNDVTILLQARAAIDATLKNAARKQAVRNALVADGWKAEQVETWTEVQTGLMVARLQFHELRDDLFCRMTLPYWQAEPGLREAERRLRDARTSGEELFPLGSLFLPAAYGVKSSHARAERRTEVLRLFEALRMFAARNGGRLPKSLDELGASTPVAIDGLTGRPFDYRLDGEEARLDLPHEKNAEGKTSLTYVIRLRSKK